MISYKSASSTSDPYTEDQKAAMAALYTVYDTALRTSTRLETLRSQLSHLGISQDQAQLICDALNTHYAHLSDMYSQRVLREGWTWHKTTVSKVDHGKVEVSLTVSPPMNNTRGGPTSDDLKGTFKMTSTPAQLRHILHDLRHVQSQLMPKDQSSETAQ